MFAKPVNVLDVAARQVVVEVTVDAAVVPEGPAQVAVELLDDARTIASARVPAVITKAGQVTVTATLDGLGDITLWDTDHPRLYHVVATLLTVDGSSLPELRIDGYLGSVRVASRSLACDPSGDVLALAADDAEIDGDGVDATRLAFRAVDRYGAPRPYVTGQVTLEVEGPAVLISDNPFDFATGGAGRRLDTLAPRLAGHRHRPGQPSQPGQRGREHPGSRGAGNWQPGKGGQRSARWGGR